MSVFYLVKKISWGEHWTWTNTDADHSHRQISIQLIPAESHFAKLMLAKLMCNTIISKWHSFIALAINVTSVKPPPQVLS